MVKNSLWKFIDDDAAFVAKDPHKITRLYFPLANEAGIMSSITPTLHGDIKTGQHSFLSVPASAEDLHNSRYNRNFWVYIDGLGAWPIASPDSNESLVEAGPLWHKAVKINKKFGLQANILNFIPTNNKTIEVMSVELINISGRSLKINPTAAIPMYGRSADRLRDHRHVSALLNRVKVDPYGVILTPTMSFDERGHKINNTSYFVLGCDEFGKAPLGSFPTILEFSGEGNNLDTPESVLKNIRPKIKTRLTRQGKEAIGAIRFKTSLISPGKSISYIIIMGITQKEKPGHILKNFNSKKKIDNALSINKKFWSEKINSIYFSTDNKNFDRWMKWVTIQPVLRKIFGCSFLPDFDYGKGGRGWRDLWQDLLTLILINPQSVRKDLINNFSGIKPDGSNATIIGKKQGEFIPDRNNIPRVWMDHGAWPFITLKLYIDQTGDTDILFEKVPYFETNKLGTVLEHILLQHNRLFTKIGKHGNFRLEGADWNDGLDMAKENGESVAFTGLYAGNLMDLAGLLEKINYKKETIRRLRKNAEKLRRHISKNEFLKLKSGDNFFNGYYDNLSRRVEGKYKHSVRMTLTGQVFPIMANVATAKQVMETYKSIKKYLWDNKLKGFRLNTDFGEIQPNLGRAFSFAYGEKENGSFFSHMNVMLAYALYKRGFAKEGFSVLSSIYGMCMNTELSKIYPGIPEYFNSDGRGMYMYLTGSASWLVLTMLTQVFGIRGETGDLLIAPKLVKTQFGRSKKVSVNTKFAGRSICVNFFNPDDLDFGKYGLEKVLINGSLVRGMPIKRETFLKLASKSINTINVYLK